MIDAGARIGITGNNGSGKSTFLNHLINKLNFADDEQIYIPQEVSEESIHN